MTEKRRRKAPYTAHQAALIAKKVGLAELQEVRLTTEEQRIVVFMLKDYALCLRREEEAALQEL